MPTYKHTPALYWLVEDGALVHTYREHALSIVWNDARKRYDGLINGADAGMHSAPTRSGLSQLGFMLQAHVDKQLVPPFKFALGQRVHSAKCLTDGVLRGNGHIKCTQFIEGRDAEPCYLIAFGNGTYHALESDINP